MMANLRKLMAAFAVATLSLTASAKDFIDYSPAKRLLEVDVHALVGSSTVTQNYRSCFPQIQNINSNMGISLGVGARAVFGIREWIGFGTAIDLSLNNYNMDMTVIDRENQGMSAIYVDNHMYKLNVPVFVSFRFKVDRNVRWNVDAGLYYNYGIGGRQKQQIYRAEINELDELVSQNVTIRTDYYHSRATFVNGFNRGDIGLHLGTSLNFGKHLVVGCQFQIGFKNQARSLGVINPNIHNLGLHGMIGYRF